MFVCVCVCVCVRVCVFFRDSPLKPTKPIPPPPPPRHQPWLWLVSQCSEHGRYSLSLTHPHPPPPHTHVSRVTQGRINICLCSGPLLARSLSTKKPAYRAICGVTGRVSHTRTGRERARRILRSIHRCDHTPDLSLLHLLSSLTQNELISQKGQVCHALNLPLKLKDNGEGSQFRV